MVSAWLVIVAIVASGIILFSSFLFLFQFQNKDDAWAGWIPKFVIVCSLFLTFGQLLIMPFDVANTRTDGGLHIDVIWDITYIAVAVMLGFVLPFAFFYYENDTDPEEKQKCCQTQTCMGFKYAIAFAIIFLGLLLILYFGIGTAIIPVVRIAQSPGWVIPTDGSSSNPNATFPNIPMGGFYAAEDGCPTLFQYDGVDYDFSSSGACGVSEFKWRLDVTFPVYIIAFLAFFGWFFFAVFAGVGLIALPMDLINAYRTRPQKMDWNVIDERQKNCGERAANLREIGEAMLKDSLTPTESQKEALKRRNRQIAFEKAFYLLQKDIEILKQLKNLNQINPLIPFFKLVAGIFCLCFSLLWVIHIAIFVLPNPPLNDFLNTYFITLENIPGFPLFGVLAYALFMYELLWAVIVGNYKIGMRCFCVNLFPLEDGDTPLNAMIANCWILLICAVPAVQFSSVCFPVYARDTYVDMLFGTQVQYLRFLSYFWVYNVFEYLLLFVNLCTLIWLFFCPKNSAKDHQDQINQMFAEREAMAKS